MELTQGSETSANYNLTPGKYPKEYIQLPSLIWQISSLKKKKRNRISNTSSKYKLHFSVILYINCNHIFQWRMTQSTILPSHLSGSPYRHASYCQPLFDLKISRRLNTINLSRAIIHVKWLSGEKSAYLVSSLLPWWREHRRVSKCQIIRCSTTWRCWDPEKLLLFCRNW